MLEFVPPKPNELDNTVFKGVSIVFRTIFNFTECSSGSSKLMFGAIKPPCIISIE